MLSQLVVTAWTLANALGTGRADNLRALETGYSGLTPMDPAVADLPCHVGLVDGIEATRLPTALRGYDCRNNRLAERALAADGFGEQVAGARARHGAARIGVFLGTSTSGIASTEAAYAAREGDGPLPPFNFQGTHSLGALADYVADRLELCGPRQTVSTACSSSAKVFAVAQRHIAAGLCDAAVVGGVDSLCLTTLYGFNSLELVSRSPARPWGAHRDGISIGEGAGFALLEPAGEGPVRLLGCGESSDAWHMSSPHPEGDGAVAAMEQALERAALTASDIDYVNLHGTGTPSNDAAEDRAVARVLGDVASCSSTKGATGHTLGAAGITEALFCCLAIEEGLIPGGVTEATLDPALATGFVTESRRTPVRHALNLSLGFGGSNACLILGETP